MILAKTFMVKMSEEWWESQVKVLLKMSFRIFKFFGKKLAKLAMHFKSIPFGRLTLNFFPNFVLYLFWVVLMGNPNMGTTRVTHLVWLG